MTPLPWPPATSGSPWVRHGRLARFGRGMLAGQRPDGIPWTIALARRTITVIRQNLFWSFTYNTLGVLAAAAGWLNPALAALLMVASSGMVIANSLRLRQPMTLCSTCRAAESSPAPSASASAAATAAPLPWRQPSIELQLPLVFLGGLLGSAHCVGMCGGFALSIGMGARGLGSNLQRQLLYTLGRVLTYAFFGVVAGYAGFWLSRKAGALVNVQAGLSIVAGGLLVFQGLLALGIVPRRLFPTISGGARPCLAGSFVGPFLAAPGWSGILIAGILTGFLPCGLVYGFLTLASSSANILHGLLTMCAFGAGTAPIMILTGAGGSLLSHSARRRLLKVSAVCVLLTGVISLARGIMFVQFPESAALESCPFCR